MHDYRTTWRQRMRPLGPAIASAKKRPANPLRQFELHDFTGLPGEGWKAGDPPRPGWYISGTLNSRYGDDCCAHWDGSRWTRWFGLKDPGVNGSMPPKVPAAWCFLWRREATACEVSLCPPA